MLKSDCCGLTDEVYTGDFVNNERHGYGRMDYRNGDSYEGQWMSGHKRGLGTHYYAVSNPHPSPFRPFPSPLSVGTP